LTPFLWPALAAGTASEMISTAAKELAHLAAGQHSNIPEPTWTTPKRGSRHAELLRLN